jgi:hypothetical protein
MRFLPFLALAFLLALAPPLRAQETAPDSEVDPAARAAVKRAADFLGRQPRFAFSADIAYEVLQDDGETLEFGELRRYLLRRPDKLRIDSQRRVGGARVVYFDGAKLTVSSPDQNAYAFVKLRQHRDVDDAVKIFRDRLGMPVPLGELLVSEPGSEFDSLYDSAFVVGQEQLEGVACDHVALRNEDNEIEVWIAKSDPPLMQRVHITYQTLEGQPRFSARLFGWTLSPDSGDALFAFEPPPNAERVRFALGGAGTAGAPPAPQGTKK